MGSKTQADSLYVGTIYTIILSFARLINTFLGMAFLSIRHTSIGLWTQALSFWVFSGYKKQSGLDHRFGH